MVRDRDIIAIPTISVSSQAVIPHVWQRREYLECFQSPRCAETVRTWVVDRLLDGRVDLLRRIAGVPQHIVVVAGPVVVVGVTPPGIIVVQHRRRWGLDGFLKWSPAICCNQRAVVFRDVAAAERVLAPPLVVESGAGRGIDVDIALGLVDGDEDGLGIRQLIGLLDTELHGAGGIVVVAVAAAHPSEVLREEVVVGTRQRGVGDPEMPAPHHGAGGVAGRDDGIALLEVRLVDGEGDVAHAVAARGHCGIGDDTARALPQHGGGGGCELIVALVDACAAVVDEGLALARFVLAVHGIAVVLSELQRVAIDTGDAVGARAVDDITVGSACPSDDLLSVDIVEREVVVLHGSLALQVSLV